MFARLREWLTLANYEAEKERATIEIVARFSRGNTSVQNGWILDENALARLSQAGDDAFARLKRLLPVGVLN